MERDRNVLTDLYVCFGFYLLLLPILELFDLVRRLDVNDNTMLSHFMKNGNSFHKLTWLSIPMDIFSFSRSPSLSLLVYCNSHVDFDRAQPTLFSSSLWFVLRFVVRVYNLFDALHFRIIVIHIVKMVANCCGVMMAFGKRWRWHRRHTVLVSNGYGLAKFHKSSAPAFRMAKRRK